MKTRLTNNYLDFVRHIKVELSRPFSVDSEVTFSVFPSLGSGHFSIQIIGEPNLFLLVRQWTQDLRDSYHLGIYNLDSVNIKEEKISILDKDLLTIQNLTKADIEIKELNGIILDGVDFELKIRRQERTEEYHWRTEEQVSTETKVLTRKLIEMAGLQDLAS